MSDIPRNAVTRAAKLATLPAGIAGRAAWGLGKRIGGKPAELVAAELQARTAEQLFRVLGELKGGAMKFGQALSIFESALPEEAAAPYRAMLTKLQDSAPPLPASVVHEVLAAEIGPRWRRSFHEFSDEPVAAASIGQVHRGIWRDGREVAVKIQYPGAGKALLSDISQLSRVAKVATVWVPGIDIKPILDELRSRMSEELDYRLEAKSQERFAKGFDGDPHFAVPHVVKGSEHVIISEWLEGRPLSKVISEGTPAERDAASQRYMEGLLVGPGRVGLLHADPHPGNFRMLPDGRLGILDFGAVNRLPDGLPVEMGTFLNLALEGNSTGTLEGLRRIGFVRPGVQIDAVRLLEYLEPFVAPLRTDTFRFSRPWLRDVFAHINDPRRPNYAVGMKLNLPP
ncbi:MAG: AarF/ABC1/UbiB kinase family protein, partial [Lapillicoccus sp.]